MTSVLNGVMESQCFNFNVKATVHQSAPSADDDSKRRQVPRACFNCRKSKTACSFERPCHRCVLHGLCDTCYDVPRKKRGFDQCPGAIVSYIPSGCATRASTEGQSGFGALFVAPSPRAQPASLAPKKEALHSESSWGPNPQQHHQHQHHRQEHQDQYQEEHQRRTSSFVDFERPVGKRERDDEFSGHSESPSKRHCGPSSVPWRDNFPSFSSDSPDNPPPFSSSSSPTRPSASDEKFGPSSSSSRVENNPLPPSSFLPRQLFSPSSSLPSFPPRSPPSPTDSSGPKLHSHPSQVHHFAPQPHPYPPQHHLYHDYQQPGLDHRFSAPHPPQHHYQQHFQSPDSPPRIDPRHYQQPYPDTDRDHYPFPHNQHHPHPRHPHPHHYQPPPPPYYYPQQQQQYFQNQPQYHVPTHRHPDSLKPEYPEQRPSSPPPSSLQETHDREFHSTHQPEHLRHLQTGQLVSRSQAQTLLHSHVLSHTSSSKYSGPYSDTQWAQEEQPQPQRRPYPSPSPSASLDDQQSLPSHREPFSFEPSQPHGRSSYTLPPLQDNSLKTSWSPPDRTPFSGFAPTYYPTKNNPQGSSSSPPPSSSSSHDHAPLKAKDGSYFSPITPSTLSSSASVEHSQPHFQYEQKPHPTSLPPLLLPFPNLPPS